MIKNETIFNKDIYFEYYWFSVRRNVVFLAASALITLCLIFLVISTVEMLRIGEMEDFLLQLVFSVILLFFVIFMFFIRPHVVFWKIQRLKSGYCFDDEHIEVSSGRQPAQNAASYDYREVKGLRRGKNALFLMLGNHSTLVLSPGGFLEGTEEELMNLLKAKTGLTA